MGRARELSELAAGYDSGGLFGFRNRIINGDMRIDQRNAGASVSANDTTVFAVDRWVTTEIGNGVLTIQRIADAPAGFTVSQRVTVATAQTGTLNAVTRQSIEGFNIADLGWGSANAQAVTLSFWVKSSLTGTFGGNIRNGDSSRSYPFSYTISSANTWEFKTVNIAGDTTGTWATDNTTGLTVWFSHGTGATGTAGTWTAGDVRGVTGQVNLVSTLNATWQITGVQLEKGSTATSFDYRPYGTELQLCQRYAAAVIQGAGAFAMGQATSSSTMFANIRLPVQMRASPAFTVSSASHFSVTSAGGSQFAAGAVNPTDANSIAFNLNLTSISTSPLVAGYGVGIFCNNASALIIASAEL